ncbi:MAG: hypothetical protein KDM64_16855, partial [Verrucomicrobiae bacterium]|nr:hypothetical protein [Verrucomicrobiae bacterium]
ALNVGPERRIRRWGRGESMARAREDLDSDLDRYFVAFKHNLNGPIPEAVRSADRLLLNLASHLDDPPNLTTARMFQVAFGSWRAAFALSMAGSASQVPILLRHALESALYGCLFANDKEWEEVWWLRETDNSAKSRFRNGAMAALWETLDRVDPNLVKRLRGTLDFLISFGAHPNVFQLVSATGVRHQSDDRSTIDTALLGDNEMRDATHRLLLGAAIDIASVVERTWMLRFSAVGGREMIDECIGQMRLFSNVLEYSDSSE